MDFSSHAVWFQTHATLPWYNRTQRFALLQQPTTIMDQWPSKKKKNTTTTIPCIQIYINSSFHIVQIMLHTAAALRIFSRIVTKKFKLYKI